MNVTDKVHVYKCLHIASSNPQLGTKLISLPVRSSFLLAGSAISEAFQNDYVAACGTVFRSSTVKNETGGYVSVPCSSKMRESHAILL